MKLFLAAMVFLSGMQVSAVAMVYLHEPWWVGLCYGFFAFTACEQVLSYDKLRQERDALRKELDARVKADAAFTFFLPPPAAEQTKPSVVQRIIRKLEPLRPEQIKFSLASVLLHVTSDGFRVVGCIVADNESSTNVGLAVHTTGFQLFGALQGERYTTQVQLDAFPAYLSPCTAVTCVFNAQLGADGEAVYAALCQRVTVEVSVEFTYALTGPGGDSVDRRETLWANLDVAKAE